MATRIYLENGGSYFEWGGAKVTYGGYSQTAKTMVIFAPVFASLRSCACIQTNPTICEESDDFEDKEACVRSPNQPPLGVDKSIAKKSKVTGPLSRRLR